MQDENMQDIKFKDLTLKRLDYPIFGIDFFSTANLSNYKTCTEFMEDRAAKIYNKTSNECIWFVEHTPMYTGGTSADDKDLLNKEYTAEGEGILSNKNIPVFKSGRGGEYTYHGKGQRTVYVMINLKSRGLGVREYVSFLENLVICALKNYNIDAHTIKGKVGIWVENQISPSSLGIKTSNDKIAAIGVRVRRWVSFHGFAINLDPDLSAFKNIVPCGINDSNFGVTSIQKQGISTTMVELDMHLINAFKTIF